MKRPAPQRRFVDYGAVGAIPQSYTRREPVMSKRMRFVGLDVHKETIAVAVAPPEGEALSLGTVPNNPEAVRKLIKKLREGGELICCYEAGPTGYVLYWQLEALGVRCVVIAPSLVPVRPGDRVKTDRAMRSSSHDYFAPGSSPRFGSQHPSTKHCVTWCAHERQPNGTSAVRGTECKSSCFVAACASQGRCARVAKLTATGRRVWSSTIRPTSSYATIS